MKVSKKSLFITFEGSEGSGKSTQSKMLTNFLRQKGLKVLNLRDPGSTRLGETVRKILLKPGGKLPPTSETLLYMVARAQLAEEKIAPALKKKMIVISDRFADATICYQGYGLGVDIKLIDELNKFVTRSTTPDITFFLDVGVKKGLKRSRKVKGFSDRIELRSLRFHNKVRKGCLILARKFPKRIKRISVEENNKEQTQQIIRKIVLDVIERDQRAGKGR